MNNLPTGSKISNNADTRYGQRRWYVLGLSPHQLDGSDDHERPVISKCFVSKAALLSAIADGTWQ